VDAAIMLLVRLDSCWYDMNAASTPYDR